MVLFFTQGINIFEPPTPYGESSSVTFKTWVRFPSAPPRNYMSNILDKLSILERLPSYQRMAARDNIGKRSKKTKKITERHEHFNKDWDKDLWD